VGEGEGFEDPVEQEDRASGVAADRMAIRELREGMFGPGFDPVERGLRLSEGSPIGVARDAGGRFVAGNPGRRRGSRNRAAGRLASALLDDFAANEQESIARLRLYYFPDYVRLLGRFLPRAGGDLRPDFAGYGPAETAAVAGAVREALGAVERGEAGLDAVLEALEREPGAVVYGESTVGNG
jgi:hypothetical protein